MRKLVNALEGYADGARHELRLISNYRKAEMLVETDLSKLEELPPGVPGRTAAVSRRRHNLWLEAIVSACSPHDAEAATRSASLIAERSINPQAVSGAQAGFLRDIFGNPFRPIELEPAWFSSTTIAMARQMYESRDFSAMPILADALQDAGCDDEQVLSHCRGDGPHARGCWVVDLALKKN